MRWSGGLNNGQLVSTTTTTKTKTAFGIVSNTARFHLVVVGLDLPLLLADVLLLHLQSLDRLHRLHFLRLDFAHYLSTNGEAVGTTPARKHPPPPPLPSLDFLGKKQNCYNSSMYT